MEAPPPPPPPPPGPNGLGGDDAEGANRAPPPNGDVNDDDIEDDNEDAIDEEEEEEEEGEEDDDAIDEEDDDDEEEGEVDEDRELCSAIQKEDLDLIRSVVERRQPVRTSNPLSAAIECGASLEIVEYVHGLYPDAVREIGGDDQSLPMHLVTSYTPPECVRFLIDRHPEALGVRDGYGKLPLYRALQQKAEQEVIEMLVLGRPRSIEEFDPEDHREGPRVLPLHVIAATNEYNPVDVMRYLFELPHGPESVRVRTPPDWGNDEYTRDCLPLHLAIQRSMDPEVIEFLLKQWRGSAQERVGRFLPLHLALDDTEFSEEVVRSVLDAYPEAVRDTDERGSTVFHIAFSNELELTELKLLPTLIKYWPDALLEADATGDLPIHVALRWEVPEKLERRADVLSKACPDSLRVANLNGQRPLHHAIVRNSLPVVRMFEDRSPGLLREVADAEGNTPAHLVAACEQASKDLARFVVEAWPESLLAINADGNTPALVAIDRSLPSSEALGVFLERCPESLRVANRKGRRPIFVAIDRNHVDIARLIVTIVPEAARHVDARGRTAVHRAASRDEGLSPDLLQVFSEACPAALRMRDVEGNLPLFLAAENDSISLSSVFLLLKKRPDVVDGRRRGAKRPRSSPGESASEGLARIAKRPRSGSPSVG
jgi:ankyrin repeat protein